MPEAWMVRVFQCEMKRLQRDMSKLILALLLAAFAAVSFPRASGATNYREYKKFDLSDPIERIPSRRHGNLKECWNHHHCDKGWKFLHQD
jgi:hypothetical protein